MSPLQRLVAWLARVMAVEVGKPNDGLLVVASSGTELDKPWDELRQEFVDALEAWRLNPLARRLVGLVTAYVVGDGIRVRAARRQVDAWLRELWDGRERSIMLEQGAWCDELTRSGELFLALFAGIDGRVVIRAIPASRIERIAWRPGDYRAELAYHEVPDGPGETGRVWYSPLAGAVAGEQSARPIMLHYAVNRPVGCVRGESDLRSILVWLRRYSRWVEDRVTLNSVVKSFVWVVKVPGHAVRSVAERYRRPPEAGRVLAVDRDSEEWQAVALAEVVKVNGVLGEGKRDLRERWRNGTLHEVGAGQGQQRAMIADEDPSTSLRAGLAHKVTDRIFGDDWARTAKSKLASPKMRSVPTLDPQQRFHPAAHSLLHVID